MTLQRYMTGDDLRAHLARLGVSQVALADLIGIHPRTLNNFVTGRAPIPPVVAVAVSGLTRKAVDEYLVDRLRKVRRGEVDP